MTPCAIIILAAGQGTRMRSARPKVLHELAGRSLLGHVLITARELKPQRLVVVVGHGAQQVQDAFPDADLLWVTQQPQGGTGHAVMTALPALEGFTGDVLVISGDVPLLESATLKTLREDHGTRGRSLSVLSTRVQPPTGYGRVVRATDGSVRAIVEERDADPATRTIDEVNSGTYCIDSRLLGGWLARLSNDNAQKEYYLTDIVALAVADGVSVGATCHPDASSLAGINSRSQLAAAERLLRDRLVAFWMEHGVTFRDPGSVWIDAEVYIGRDCIIEPHVILGSGVVLGQGCHVGAFCHLDDTRVGDGSVIEPFCHLHGATLEGPNNVGPFARLRPEAHLAPKARVGNFCEVKKAYIGAGTKVNHLSYIGDAHLGAGVNVGAGTITCNYDGVKKHRTEIGDGVFIGSDTQLVAPVRVGDHALIGAGTTVTKDVPAWALALSREPQVNLSDWVKRKRGKD
ncbi:MAG: bifunctional UDP-N-acetylglucosamine diphosphorylase/glucosamine-1-phosphate N-acetyltransferase GlmU [Magnetococcus sp. WYHC-3]